MSQKNNGTLDMNSCTVCCADNVGMLLPASFNRIAYMFSECFKIILFYYFTI